MRVDNRVIVRKDDDLTARREHAAVAGARQARTRRGDNAQASVLNACELLAGQARLRRVIHHDERETLVILGQDGAHGVLEHVARADRAHDDGRVHVGTGALLPAASGGRFNLEHARIRLRMVRALDLDERRITAVVAHEHERSRIRRVARNQLGDARGAVNVPDGGGLVVGHGGFLGAHFLPFFEEALDSAFLETAFLESAFSSLTFSSSAFSACSACAASEDCSRASSVGTMTSAA